MDLERRCLERNGRLSWNRKLRGPIVVIERTLSAVASFPTRDSAEQSIREVVGIERVYILDIAGKLPHGATLACDCMWRHEPGSMNFPQHRFVLISHHLEVSFS